MNVERLHSIAKALQQELQTRDVVQRVASLHTALANQANAPQDPSYQQQVATMLQSLEESLSSAESDDFPPTWRQVIEELGIERVLGTPLLLRIQEVFARNQITTTVARDEMAEISAEVQRLGSALQSLLDSLDYFKIGAEELEPGDAEVGVLIPRAFVAEELPALGVEFERLQRILNPFLELGDSRAPLKIRTISSSDFAVYVAMAPAAAMYVANATEKVLEIYKKLLEVRRLRQEMADNGMTDEDLAAIDARANSMMSEATEVIANDVVDEAVVTDGHRANELKVEIRLSLNALANRIDQGFNIDVRAGGPPPDSGTDDGSPDSRAIIAIKRTGPRLAFVNRTGRPILSLPEGGGSEPGRVDEN